MAISWCSYCFHIYSGEVRTSVVLQGQSYSRFTETRAEKASSAGNPFFVMSYLGNRISAVRGNNSARKICGSCPSIVSFYWMCLLRTVTWNVVDFHFHCLVCWVVRRVLYAYSLLNFIPILMMELDLLTQLRYQFRPEWTLVTGWVLLVYLVHRDHMWCVLNFTCHSLIGNSLSLWLCNFNCSVQWLNEFDFDSTPWIRCSLLV